MIEDTAIERLLAMAGFDEDEQPRPMSDAEHRRVFGWGWDDPDHADLDLIWDAPRA